MARVWVKPHTDRRGRRVKGYWRNTRGRRHTPRTATGPKARKGSAARRTPNAEQRARASGRAFGMPQSAHVLAYRRTLSRAKVPDRAAQAAVGRYRRSKRLARKR